MRRNVGSMDQLIRLIAGAALIIGAYFAGAAAPWVAAAGTLLFLTGLVQICPVYLLLGLRTVAR